MKAIQIRTKKLIRLSRRVVTVLALAIVMIMPIVSQTFAATDEQYNDVQKNSSFHDGEAINTCTPTAGSPESTEPKPPGKVFVLGDSISDGIVSAPLSDELKEADGWTIKSDTRVSRPLSEGINIAKTKPADLLDSDYVLVVLGTNPDSKNTAEGIKEMVDAIREANSTARIFWQTLNVTDTELKAGADAFNEFLKTSSGIDLIQNTITPDSEGVHYADYKPLAKLVAAAFIGASSGEASTLDSTSECCSATSGSTTLTGADNGEKVWNFLISKGLNNIQAAAIMGNFQAESQFNPTITNSSSGAYGLAQWLPKQKLIDRIAESGTTGSPDLLETQVAVMWWELTTEGKAPTGYNKNTNVPYLESTGIILDDLKSITDPDENTLLEKLKTFFHQYYEGSLGQGNDDRSAFALAWLNKAKGGTGSGADGAAADPVAASSSCGAPTSGATTDPDSGYSSPFRDTTGLTQSRIDRGVDYASTQPVPFYAIGNGVVTLATSESTFYTTSGDGDGTPYSTWITYQLTDGPAKDKYIFVSEACAPILVKVGDVVTKDTQLCSVLADSIETGWAADATTQQPNTDSAIYEAHHGCKTAYGMNFNQLMLKLGAMGGYTHASNQCVRNGGNNDTILGELAPGWPTWE